MKQEQAYTDRVSHYLRMTPKRVFWGRVVTEWKNKWKAWRTVIDWIVALYIVIPFTAAGVWLYWSIWFHPPAWFSYVPTGAVGLVVFILAWSGSVRWFVEEGDLLFLRQRKEWLQTLRLRGVLYSIMIQAVGSAAFMLLTAPLILLEYEWTYSQWIGLGMILFTLRLCLSAARQFIGELSFARKLGSYVALGMGAALLTGGMIWLLSVHAVFGWLGALCIGGLSVVLLRLRLRTNTAFMYEVEQERKIKGQTAAFIVADVVKKKPLVKLRQPILLSQSNRLLRRRTFENLLAETGVKTFFRSFSKLKPYAQFTLIGMAAIALSPFIIRWIVLGGLGLLLPYWLRWHWNEHMQSSFLKLFRYERYREMEASETFIGMTMLPCWTLLCVETAILGLPSLYGLLAIPGGMLFMYGVVKLQVFFQMRT